MSEIQVQPDTTDIEKTARTIKVEEQSNAEGSFHQGLLGGKANTSLFKPLDGAFMDAVHRDAESVVYTPEEEVCSLSILPSSSCSQDLL
jgi:hypothetical protein